MKKLSIILGVLSMCISLTAANKITGKVMDESSNQSVEYANVKLMAQDSTFITGAATDNDGNFLLKEVKDGDYILCVSCIGYGDSYLSIRNLKENLQLGEVSLSPNNIQLEGIVITASPIIKKTDRQIILPTEVQSKVASNGLTLLRNLQLARILVNPIDNSIKLPGGESPPNTTSTNQRSAPPYIGDGEIWNGHARTMRASVFRRLIRRIKRLANLPK